MLGLDIRSLQTLAFSRWFAVHAMPVQNRREVLLDVLFVTSDATFSMIAKDLSLDNKSEVFYLDVAEFAPTAWWKHAGIGISRQWKPRNLKDELDSSGFGTLLDPPRLFRPFTMPELLDSSQQSALYYVGIQFQEMDSRNPHTLTFVASQEFHCTIDFAFGTEGSSEILQGLREVHVGP